MIFAYSLSCILIHVQTQLCYADPDINRKEQFEKDGVTVTLEWTQENSYNFSVFPSLPIIFSGDANVQLKVPYNTVYNISLLVIPPNPCGQNDTFFEVYYGRHHLL